MTGPAGRVGSDTVTVQRAPLVRDQYGAEHRDWANAINTELPGVSVNPLVVLEDTAGREQTSERLRLIAPSTADLAATDRVVWRGGTYELDGPPERWSGLTSVAHHIEATLKRLAG